MKNTETKVVRYELKQSQKEQKHLELEKIVPELKENEHIKAKNDEMEQLPNELDVKHTKEHLSVTEGVNEEEFGDEQLTTAFEVT